MGGSSNVTVVYTPSGVSGTVVIQIEGTQDGTNWVNLDENGSTSITSDATYGFEKSEVNYTAVRFNWVSGTATNIVVSMQKNSG
jgi:hypothetical protein